MSNPSTIAETEGFSARLAHAGEALTFRSGSVTALVNRNPIDKKDDPRRLDLNPRDTSEIELFADAVTPVPGSGESFLDEFGHYHRIQKVKRLGVTVHCYCDVADAA